MAFHATAIVFLALMLPTSAFLKTAKEEKPETGKTNDDPIETWKEMLEEYKPKNIADPLSKSNFFKTKTAKVETASNTKKRRARVISDVHIGGCWSSDKGTQERFMSMLREMASGSSTDAAPLTHLVLLGDTFDWWLVPLGEATPHPTALFESQDAYGYNVVEIVSLLKQISKRTKIYLVRGNHDDAITKDLTKLAFGDAVQFMEDGFELDGVWLEHGNIIDLYSNPPTGEDGIKKKGFSYFVSRAGADEDGWQCKRKTKRAFAEQDVYVKFVRQSVEFMMEQPFGVKANRVVQNWYLKNTVAVPAYFVPTHLEGVLKVSNPNFKTIKYQELPVTGLNNAGDTILWESSSQNYTLGDAIKDHTHDMELWAKNLGSQHTLARLYASGLENHFKWAPLSRRHLVLVSGHTHSPYIATLPRAKPAESVADEVVFVNSGAFAQDSFGRDHSSYIDITFEQSNSDWRPATVKYFEFPEKEPREQSTVPLARNKMSGLDVFLHPDKNEMVVAQI